MQKRLVMSILLASIILLVISIVSAGFLEKLKGAITGEATQTVNLNITVGTPQIVNVWNNSLGVDLSISRNSNKHNS